MSWREGRGQRVRQRLGGVSEGWGVKAVGQQGVEQTRSQSAKVSNRTAVRALNSR